LNFKEDEALNIY